MISPKSIIGSFARQHKLLAGGVLLSLLISNLLNVLLPLSIGLFYEAGLQEKSTKGELIHKFFPFIDNTERFFIFFVVLIVLKSVSLFWEKYWIGVLGERFSRWLREKAFNHQLRLPFAEFRKRPVGKYLLRYSGDLNAIREFVNKGVLLFAGDVFFLTCAFAALFAVHSRFAGIVLGIWVLAALLIYTLSRQLRVATFDRRGQRSKGLAFVSERLHAFYTVKSFNRERPETERYARESGRLMRFGLLFFRRSAAIQALFPVFFFGTLGLILWLAGNEPADPNNKGDFFAFILLLLHIHTVLQRVLEVNLIWQSGSVSLHKFAALLNKPIETRDSEALPKDLKGNVVFEDVSFGFSKGKPVLENLNFNIPAGSITLLQGKHGAGKSTVLKLLQKMYEPQSGKITLDNIDLALVSAFELRKNVSVVSPEAQLLGRTVFQAISYSESPEKREKAKVLLEKLRFSLDEDPDKTLDWRLEENARNLSSGQTAMLQILRALLTDKPIILLDEPFVQLDSRQASRAARLLNRLKTKHTIVLIAKRPPTRLEIDHTISLDNLHDTEDATDLDDRSAND